MKTTKTNSTDSPKTPGGISKSLLTPCRRVGLSRNWKKSGPSPFNSPLSGTPEVKKVEKVEKKTRKRKESCEETQSSQDAANTPESQDVSVISTPVRNIDLPRRKKSKTLLSNINNTTENQDSKSDLEESSSGKENSQKESIDVDNQAPNHISTPILLKSRSKSIKKSPIVKRVPNVIINENNETKEDTEKENSKKSPNNLTKECIVLIQKKIFKKDVNDDNKEDINNKELHKHKEQNAKTSQNLVDSDTDNIPLCQLNKTEITKSTSNDDDEDFTHSKTIKQTNTETKKELQKPKKTNSNSHKPKTKNQNLESKIQNLEKTQNTQISIEGEDDDDFFEKKRTIVVKKTYIKPIKAKSTGSITQKDIDDLKSRIEKKKKMLLAKTLTNDTKELRDLIKKWQKGCQEALIQLMDLMKDKMPDNQPMDYSNMLKALKIPANLVGYDSENDNFVTPDDENIILANM